MSVLHWLFGKHPPRPANPERAVGLDPIPHWLAELVVDELGSLGIHATISDHQIALSRDGKLTEGAKIWVMEPNADIAKRVIDEMESGEAPRFVLRRTAASDADFLVAALEEALWPEPTDIDQTDGPDVSTPDHFLGALDVMEDPTLRAYIEDFGGRAGDSGWIAEDLDGTPIGAAWCRVFPGDTPGYGFVRGDIAELAMAVAPTWRGQGVGSALLVALLDDRPVMSLSVHGQNPARRLYERFGFVEVQRDDHSIVMLRRVLPG